MCYGYRLMHPTRGWYLTALAKPFAYLAAVFASSGGLPCNGKVQFKGLTAYHFSKGIEFIHEMAKLR